MFNVLTVPLRSAEIDVTAKGVSIGVTVRAKHMGADWSSLNYLAKASFGIE